MAEVVGFVSGVAALIELSAKIAITCAQYSKDVKNAREDIDRLLKEVARLSNVSKSVDELLGSPRGAELRSSQKMADAVKDALSQLERLQQKFLPGIFRKTMRQYGLRALKWPFQSKDVDQAIQDLDRCTVAISLALQVDQTAILLDVNRNMILDRLPRAAGASFDSHAEEHNATCLPDTRVDLLDQIYRWVDDPTAKPVFWLNGMAGTGKSTISRTVARVLANKNQLGASFFFKKGEADRGSADRFFTTIAADLASRVPGLAPYVKSAIDVDPAIPTKQARVQFEKLILEPLSKLPQDTWQAVSLVILVDALDECEQDDDVKLIISILSGARSLTSLRLRVFATSRPDLPIRIGFHAAEGAYRDSILHEIPQPVIKNDISLFLEHNLAKIRQSYNATVPKHRQLQASWPGQADIEKLVEMAVPLFIFAATVCRFLADRRCGDPGAQLHEVLQFQANNQASQLSATYLPVLNKLVTGLTKRDREKVLDRFSTIVGSIIILSSPLSISALTLLLDIDQNIINNMLDMLHSVLSIPSHPTSPVRLLHLSFRDFLIDAEEREAGEAGEAGEFWVDEKQAHNQMVVNCLRIMKARLQRDICKLQAPGTLRSTIDPQTIDKYLPSEVRYACLCWVHHLQQGEISPGHAEQIYNFFTHHFLHWLEALSLIDRASEILTAIKNLQSLLAPGDCEELRVFLDDALRFVLSNLFIIDSAPLQIYTSALVFSPTQSVTRRMFTTEEPAWMITKPAIESNWSPCLQTLEGHSGSVNSVAFSADSKLVASGSFDKTVKIWDAATGAEVRTLKGHRDLVNSVAFSADSKLVASGSNDNTVKIWDASTGAEVRTLEGHSSSVNSVAFSADSKLVASGSFDETVKIWDAATGAEVRTLEGHSSSVNSVAFSADSKLVASGSFNNTVKIWDAATGAEVRTLEGHRGWVNSVAFSADSKLVASGSSDKTVKIWDAATGAEVQTLNVGTSLYTISFNAMSSFLITDIGLIRLNSANPDIGTETQGLAPLQLARLEYGLSSDRTWISWNGNDVLWLPPDYRPSVSAVLLSSVAIGCGSGRVFIINFSGTPIPY